MSKKLWWGFLTIAPFLFATAGMFSGAIAVWGVTQGDYMTGFVIAIVLGISTQIAVTAINNLRLIELSDEANKREETYQVIRRTFEDLIQQGVLTETSPDHFQLTPKGKQTIEGTTNHE